MRELDEKEISAIAGGYRAGVPAGASRIFWPGGPVNPLTVTFGTPTGPSLALPGYSDYAGYWPRGMF